VNTGDWFKVVFFGLAAAIEAGVNAGREKRDKLQGQAAPIDYKARQAQADAARPK